MRGSVGLIINASFEYYINAFKQIDKAIEYVLKNKDKCLLGVKWNHSTTSESMLHNDMIGSSILKTAILLRTKIASDVRCWKDLDIKYGSELHKYLNGDLGPDIDN